MSTELCSSFKHQPALCSLSCSRAAASAGGCGSDSPWAQEFLLLAFIELPKIFFLSLAKDCKEMLLPLPDSEEGQFLFYFIIFHFNFLSIYLILFFFFKNLIICLSIYLLVCLLCKDVLRQVLLHHPGSTET